MPTYGIPNQGPRKLSGKTSAWQTVNHRFHSVFGRWIIVASKQVHFYLRFQNIRTSELPATRINLCLIIQSLRICASLSLSSSVRCGEFCAHTMSCLSVTVWIYNLELFRGSNLAARYVILLDFPMSQIFVHNIKMWMMHGTEIKVRTTVFNSSTGVFISADQSEGILQMFKQ